MESATKIFESPPWIYLSRRFLLTLPHFANYQQRFLRLVFSVLLMQSWFQTCHLSLFETTLTFESIISLNEFKLIKNQLILIIKDRWTREETGNLLLFQSWSQLNKIVTLSRTIDSLKRENLRSTSINRLCARKLI